MDGGVVPGRLLTTLPPLVVVEAELGSCPVGPAAFEEVVRAEPGQQVLLDRILDLMLITALRLLHTDPAHPWTPAAPAGRTGVSRAALARRFTTLVGQPPMTYLRDRRLTLAADLLREPGTTIAAAAGRVGLSSAFALSTAFKRERGVSPSTYRTGTARAQT